MKKLVVISIILCLAVPVFAAGGAEDDGKTIVGLSFSDFATERWPREQALLTQLGQERGVQVISQVANQDAKLQNDQIENLIVQNADVIVVIAQDGGTAATAVDAAASEGIPVIAYDRLIKSSNLALYISFNNVAVGRAQAEGILNVRNSGNFVLLGGSPTDNNAHLFRQGQVEVLQPLIDSGQIKIVADQWVENWDAANAVKLMENILTATNNDIDAVVASNDGTALGALQALKAQGLAGVVPISGQDATAAGAQSIVADELTLSVYKDIRLLAPKTMDYAVQLANGEELSDVEDYTLAELTLDDSATGSIACFFFPVVQVTKDNLYDVVVASGFQDYDDVYRNVPADQRPPRP